MIIIIELFGKGRRWLFPEMLKFILRHILPLTMLQIDKGHTVFSPEVKQISILSSLL